MKDVRKVLSVSLMLVTLFIFAACGDRLDNNTNRPDNNVNNGLEREESRDNNIVNDTVDNNVMDNNGIMDNDGIFDNNDNDNGLLNGYDNGNGNGLLNDNVVFEDDNNNGIYDENEDNIENGREDHLDENRNDNSVLDHIGDAVDDVDEGTTTGVRNITRNLPGNNRNTDGNSGVNNIGNTGLNNNTGTLRNNTGTMR